MEAGLEGSAALSWFLQAYQVKAQKPSRGNERATAIIITTTFP